MSTGKQYIICLKGVDPEDYLDIEDIFEQQIKESADLDQDITSIEVIAEFNSIPSQFTTLENHPPSTNLRCWYCDFTFTTRSVFIPTYITKDYIGIMGNFCSFTCASSYIARHSDVNRECELNLTYLYKIFTGRDIKYIPPGPKKYSMQKYGGHVTDEKYLQQISELEKKLEVGSGIKCDERKISPINIPNGISAWDLL